MGYDPIHLLDIECISFRDRQRNPDPNPLFLQDPDPKIPLLAAGIKVDGFVSLFLFYFSKVRLFKFCAEPIFELGTAVQLSDVLY